MISGVNIKNKHNSFALVGIGATNKHLYDIVQPENPFEARREFGDCALVDAYESLCIDSIDDVFIMNIENLHGYMRAAHLLGGHDFTYVIPIDLMMSDFFYDPTQDGRKTYYAQYLAQQKTNEVNTTYIITDAHASLYENIDAFLDDMGKKRTLFKKNLLTNDPYDDIIFVANNIANTAWSNIELARMIRNTTPMQYPFSPATPNAVFDIDFTDNIDDMAYFKSHADGSTTIENLLTMYPYGDPMKIFTVYRICLYIGRELDFTDYIGVYYTPYKKKLIQEIVENYLSSIKGKLITDYEVTEVYAVVDEGHPGTVKVIVRYKISPIGFDERFIEREVIV